MKTSDERDQLINDLVAALEFLVAEFDQHVSETETCPKIRESADQARVAIRAGRSFQRTGATSGRDAYPPRLGEAAPDLYAVLRSIVRAHETKNCGVINGEAVLCKALADQGREALDKADGKIFVNIDLGKVRS